MKIEKPSDNVVKRQISEDIIFIKLTLIFGIIILFFSFVTNNILLAIVTLLIMVILICHCNLSQAIDKTRLEIRELKSNKKN